MSNKAERPTLQGQRFRTRKRDEKEKFNPTGFRDTILHNFDELNGGLCLKNNNSPCNNITNSNNSDDTDSLTTATKQQTANSNLNNSTCEINGDSKPSLLTAAAVQSSDQGEEQDSSSSTNTSGNKNGVSSPSISIDIDAVIKCLLSDTKIDYRLYGEQLFDIIIAGGILAPGGTILADSDSSKQYRTDICLFKAVDANDLPGIKNFANIFVRLIQRFGYLEKTLEEELKKIIVFLKAFEPDERTKLAKLTAVLIALGIVNPSVLLSGIQDHLVKDAIALDFLVQVLQTWIIEKDSNTVWNSMRRAGVDNKLLDFLPPNKRSSENIIQIFQNNGLQALVNFQKTKESEAKKLELQRRITSLIKNKASNKEILVAVKESTTKNSLDESELVVLIWKTLMSIVEWNKKEEIGAEQAMKHLKTHAALMEAFTKSAKAQLALIVRIQEYCYENMNFLKVFHKIIILLYKADVLTEDIIIEWYKRAHSNKGKSVFLEQIQPFIEWLTSAEEESEEE